ncbi:hypothetical protein OR1_02611 [Geobacter sp. OR-1]|uniref:hypothetical protein n=1 Tax=Geobacter sp. OR-1 TaxID=1266765 RepID=UPI0005434DBD|nr:hypothetical protein [Geobacter sp. OR-1]GAM10322.1 hypothetical protein OR1_02611 [Geobacter sp. OR-1]
MNNITTRIIIGSITIFVSLLIAWRIGLWLEPAPEEKSAIVTRSSAAKEPPFASGKVRENLPFELRNVKVTDGGRSIEGVGIVRFDIDRSDIKPAVIAILRVINAKFPVAKQIALSLTPSVDCPVCKIAEAKYDNGRVRLDFGTPTLKQIEESNSRIGVPSASGKVEDRPLLSRPNGETFGTGLNVMIAIAAGRKKNPGMNDDQLLDQASAATGLSYVVVKRHRDFMTAYYSGNAFGSETFDM